MATDGDRELRLETCKWLATCLCAYLVLGVDLSNRIESGVIQPILSKVQNESMRSGNHFWQCKIFPIEIRSLLCRVEFDCDRVYPDEIVWTFKLTDLRFSLRS